VSVFEWLNGLPELHGRVAVFGTWGVFNDIFNRARSGLTVQAGPEPPKHGKLSSRDELLNELYRTTTLLDAEDAYNSFVHVAMLDYVKEHKTVDGFPGAEPLSNADLFSLDVDILIPAALENQITIDNAAAIKAKIIIEGANGPTTPDAHKYLHEHGVFVVPDILANSSGVTTSYFEWVQDRYGYFWTEKEVNERLEAKMCEAFNAVLQTSLKYRVDMRTAAYIVAIGRVATVTRMRGMYA